VQTRTTNDNCPLIKLLSSFGVLTTSEVANESRTSIEKLPAWPRVSVFKADHEVEIKAKRQKIKRGK
jgi:hypothetical protein